ncbi:MAG: acetolactate decarboxylase [Ignavibacteriales bacterium]|nr:acetolactate decarboxylase [Ignavibacteriales bacterium]
MNVSYVYENETAEQHSTPAGSYLRHNIYLIGMNSAPILYNVSWWKKQNLSILFLSILSFACGSTSNLRSDSGTIHQVSTYGDLMNGMYDGMVTIGALKERGNFGDKLNGELVALDDTVYQILYDGNVQQPDNSITTPFAVVTRFEAERTSILGEIGTMKDFCTVLDTLLADTASLFAIKVEGTFRSIKTRSVASRSKPYAPFTAVIQHQSVFEFGDIDGVMVGFYTPSLYAGMSPTGYHFHFISADRLHGGHVLEVHLGNGNVAIDKENTFNIILTGTQN